MARATFVPPHKFHSPLDNEARFVHVIHGRSTMHFPTKQVQLTSGDSIIIKCGNLVNHWHENEDGSANKIISFQLFPNVLQYIYHEDLPKELKAPRATNIAPFVKLNSDTLLKQYFDGLQVYLDSSSTKTEEFLKIKMRELIYLLANSRNSHMKSFLSQLFHSPNYQFQEIVHAHLYQQITLKDLAFLSGHSVSTFQRKFKTAFGTSPKQYILAKRLEKAANLLTNSNLQVSEIAFDCGFEDVSHFSKSFTAKHKLSPSAFRAKQ